MEIGLANAYAQDLGYNQQVNDLRYRQDAIKQQEALNESKRRLFESDVEVQNGGNAFDQPLVKAESQKIISDLGKFLNENPDWETNFQKRGIVKQMKRSLKDNPHVLRAMTTNDNRKALLEYANTMKGKQGTYDDEALNNELTRYQNYEQFGNPDGQEAAQKEGAKAYLFTRPQDFINLPEALTKAGSQVKDFDIVPTKYGGYYSKPKPEQIAALTDAMIQQNSRQIQVEAKKMGMTSDKQVRDWVKNGIEAGIQKQFKLGDQLGYWEAGMRQKAMNADAQEKLAKAKSQNSSYRPWDYFTDEKNNPAGTISADDFYKVWGSKHPIKAVGSDGSTADLSDFDFKPNGRYINQNGVTFVQGYVDVPINIAEERGLYKQGMFTIDGVTAPYKDDVKEITLQDKDGSEVKAVRVNYNLPINRKDPNARQKFDIMVDVDKNVQSFNPIEQGGQGTYQGYKIGTVLNTNQGSFIVTPNGYKRQ